ncbi:MAG TPA: FAD:protein FMN transferase [Bacteroidales bacterium]
MVNRLLLLGMILIFLTCCSDRNYFHIEGLAQGTTYHVTYRGNRDFSHSIDSILKAVDKSLNAWDSSSIISRINNNDTSVVADSLFVRVFTKAKQINRESHGLFDITVAPLVKAWGFYRKQKTLPDSLEIKHLLSLVGMGKIELKNNKIIKQNPNITLDVNAIAPGLSVDVVAEFLQRQGVADYMVEIGGELKCCGLNPDRKRWHVGIEAPIEGTQMMGEELSTVVQISGRAMATSGNYRKFIVENGIKYGHHLNPITGYPSKNPLLSVTIIANDCVSADAYATACIVMGPDKAKEFLLTHNDLDAYFIYSDNRGNYQVFMTNRLKSLVQK